MPPGVSEQLAATRAQLDAACDLLIAPTPQALDRCSMILEAAGREAAERASSLAEIRGNNDAIAEARRLRRSVQRARSLLENAARFHIGWLAIRGALTGGYTDRGEPAPVRHAGRICLEA
jgi:hypothetical protein